MITFKTPINFSISDSQGSLELTPLSSDTCDLAAADDYGDPGYIHIYLNKYLKTLSLGEKKLIIEMIQNS